MKRRVRPLAVAVLALGFITGASRAPEEAAEFVQASVPKVVAAGSRQTVTITMKNVGTAPWTKTAGYRLGAQNPHDNSTWGTNRVDLPASVPGQGVVTFQFGITAPKTPGTYNFQWRMVHEGVAWFGPLTPNVAIDVH